MSNSLDPMACSPPGSSVHEDSPGKNTGVGCHAFIQGIFSTREWTLQADSLPSEPPGKPMNNAVGCYPFSKGSSQPRNRTGVSSIVGGFFTNWATREALDKEWSHLKVLQAYFDFLVDRKKNLSKERAGRQISSKSAIELRFRDLSIDSSKQLFIAYLLVPGHLVYIDYNNPSGQVLFLRQYRWGNMASESLLM